jgi:IS5 family transposase
MEDTMIEIQNSEDKNNQLFETKTLEDEVNQDHPLIILSKKIRWDTLEYGISKLYSDRGRPGKLIRLMIGLLLLQYIFKLSDRRVVAAWSENLYYQAFTGQTSFVLTPPCDPSMLSVFRRRIGQEGCKLIFAESVRIHGKGALEKEAVIDTTVQEKNITYPTDSKLILKAIALILRIGLFLQMTFTRSYKIKIKRLKSQINFGRNSKDQETKKKAVEQLRSIANYFLKSFISQLPKSKLALYPIKRLLMVLSKAINQRKTDKNKIYSIHEPQVKCIPKGKADKKFEFGSKVSFIVSKGKGIILGALNFNDNLYDGDTIAPAIKQLKSLHGGYKPETIVADRGYRGRPEVNGVKILSPYDYKKGILPSLSRKFKNLLGRRVIIEALIGHLKQDHRLGKNLLKGTLGDTINPLLAAAAFNFVKYTRIKYEDLHRPPRSLAIQPRHRRKKVINLPLWRKDSNSLF